RVRRAARQAWDSHAMLCCILIGGGLCPRDVTQRSLSTQRLDRIAMGLSGLCLVHCVATAVLLGLLASAGGLLGQPIIHEVGLSLAMMIGAFALGRGIIEHGFVMPAAIGALGLGVMAGALSLPEGGHEPI